MLCAFYILFWPDSETEYPHSELLLNRRYRNDIPEDEYLIRNFETAFKKLHPEEKVPFIECRGYNYTFIRGDYDILIMAVSIRNINAMSTIVFLNHFYRTLSLYLCDERKKTRLLNRDTVVDNLMLIFDLLDECMDFGIIQVTDYNILKEYIKIEANLPKLKFDGSRYDSESETTEEEEEDESEDGDQSHTNSKSKKSKSKAKAKAKAKSNDTVKSTHNQANITDVIEQDNTLVNSSILRTYSSAINWRPKGIFYAKNEIYIDIIEDCEFYYDLGTDKIKKNEIHGTCAVKCYLSGMPKCKIGFNEQYISSIDNEGFVVEDAEITAERLDNQLVIEKDDDADEDEDELVPEEASQITEEPKEPSEENKARIPIRNIQFHQCIELGSIYKDNLVTFTPPDDKFVLMTYSVEQQKQKRKSPLIMIRPTYRILKDSRKLQILCVLSTKFRKRLHCRDLVVKIPIDPQIFDVSQDTEDSLKYKTEMGEVSYKIDSSDIVWTIDDITGKKSVKMMAELSLSSTEHIGEKQVEDSLFNRVVELSDTDSDEDNVIQELDTYYGVNGRSTSSKKTILKTAMQNNTFNDIKVTFNIPLLSYSGLKLTYLRVDEEQMKYTCFPWVRYITEAGNIAKSEEKRGKGPSQLSTNSDCVYRFKLATDCFHLM